MPRPAENSAIASSGAKLAAGITACGFLASIACAAVSPDGIHHFDDLTHFLYAKWAWTWPIYLLDHWGRPGFTALYFPAAALGWTACRILSAALSAAGGWFAFRIAEHCGLRHAWAAALLTWAQPLYFQLSHTTLTETPLAFYLAGAVLLALRGRWSISSAVLSIGIVTRHEAIVFVPIWLFFAHRRGVALWRLWPIAWAPLAVNALLWQFGETTIAELYFRPRPSTQYGRDGWLSFVARSMHAWGPGVSALAFTGLLAAPRCGSRSIFSHNRRLQKMWHGRLARAFAAETAAKQVVVRLLPRTVSTSFPSLFAAACVAAYFIAQTVVRVFGLFDSGGYARFLVPIGPLVAVMALLGWNVLTSKARKARRRAAPRLAAAFAILWIALELQVRRQDGIELSVPIIADAIVAMRILAIAMLALVAASLLLDRRRVNAPAESGRIVPRAIFPVGIAATIALTAFAMHRPLSPPPEAAMIRDTLRRLNEMGLAGRQIESANVWIEYVTNRKWPPSRPPTRMRIEQAPIGTLVAWEAQFAGSPDHGLRLSEFTPETGYRRVLESSPLPLRASPYLYIFEKIAAPKPQNSADMP